MKPTAKRRVKFVIPLILAAFLAVDAPATEAALFNPHYIISDSEIRDAHTMSFTDIYRFLEQKGGLNTLLVAGVDHFNNANKDIDEPDGLDDCTSLPASVQRGVAQAIHDTALCYNINPMYILALMQKESGIVETATPTQRQMDWATGYALCDGCSRHSTLAQKYMGLGEQVDVGAGWMDWYFTNAKSLRYQPGVTYVISSTSVTPANLTTAALYNYTPHIQGNRLLWSIWNRWWGDGLGMQYPEGTLLRSVDTGAVALIQNKKFRPVVSQSVLISRFNTTNIIDVSDDEFRMYQESSMGRPVQFADLSIVKTETGDIYLLVGQTKRLIPSDEIFAELGYHPEEVEEVLAEDIEEYAPGAPIAPDEAFPTGGLVQNNVTGGVYYAESGMRYPIWDKAVLDINFPNRKMIPMSPEELESLERGAPVLFRDGILVKTPGNATVYIISGGVKRPIPSEEVFYGFGYKFENVVTAGEAMLSLHAAGEPLLLLTEEDTTPSTEA